MSTLMPLIENTFYSILGLYVSMAPWLLLGFLIAGLLRVFLPEDLIARHLSGRGMSPIVKATLLGIPLPLCSCGVIPVAAHVRRQGASPGATVAFLASTPSTGVDSIMATWALMGPAMAMLRPLYALISGLLAGVGVALFDPPPKPAPKRVSSTLFAMAPVLTPTVTQKPETSWNARVKGALRYGLIDLVRDVQKWLLIGVVVGGVIAAALPDALFQQVLASPVQSYVLMLAAGIPMYICATGSIPIAAALIVRGMSPGAALIFLAVGPATNAATLVFIAGQAGKRAAAIYLLAIASSALAMGILVDLFFAHHVTGFLVAHGNDGHLSMISVASAVILGGIMLFNTINFMQRRNRASATSDFRPENKDSTVAVEGSSGACPHCTSEK
jgi:uncharacterized membrane protein YraQ (UPF0718 family)